MRRALGSLIAVGSIVTAVTWAAQPGEGPELIIGVNAHELAKRVHGDVVSISMGSAYGMSFECDPQGRTSRS